MIRAIFFDSGNVLVKEGFTDAVSEYENKHGLVKGSLYASVHDRPWWKNFTLGNITEQEYFEKVALDFKTDLNTNELRTLILNNFVPNTELLDFIKTLKSRFTLWIISNNPKEWFDYFWQSYGWDQIFQ